jgi:hypothetical protein
MDVCMYVQCHLEGNKGVHMYVCMYVEVRKVVVIYFTSA